MNVQNLSNPLIVLGLGHEVISLLVSKNDRKSILQIAESNYRTYAKVFHPDLPNGDSETMQRLTEAREEIQDPDALTYYVEELLGNIDSVIPRRFSKVKKSEDHLVSIIQGLARRCSSVNQFSALKIARPETYICNAGNSVVVLDVLNSEKSRLQIYSDPGTSVIPASDFKYASGHWKIRQSAKEGARKWFDLGKPESVELVRVIGHVSEGSTIQNTTSGNPQGVTSARKLNQGIAWLAPEDAWFLSSLSTNNTVRNNLSLPENSSLVLYKEFRSAGIATSHGATEGVFAVSPVIVARSQIKT